jgi:hypothetical protein
MPEILELFRSAGYENPKDVTLENEARHMLAVLGTRSAAKAPVRVPAQETRLDQPPAGIRTLTTSV